MLSCLKTRRRCPINSGSNQTFLYSCSITFSTSRIPTKYYKAPNHSWSRKGRIRTGEFERGYEKWTPFTTRLCRTAHNQVESQSDPWEMRGWLNLSGPLVYENYTLFQIHFTTPPPEKKMKVGGVRYDARSRGCFLPTPRLLSLQNIHTIEPTSARAAISFPRANTKYSF